PWGGLEVADAHVHFFSRTFFERLAGQKAGLTVDGIGAQLAWSMPDSAEQLAAQWVHELDRHSVAKAALMASVPGDEESVAAAVAGHPDRFFATAMVDPARWNPDRLENIRVACLFPAMHRFAIWSEQARRVFEWAAAHGRAVFVHCGMLSVGVRTKLGLESRFDMRFSNPIDLHALAMEFAEVPIILPHFGAGYFREALMLADLCPNVYLDTSSSNGWMRTQESHLDLRQVFKRALDVVGSKRLLFGTDSSFFPRGWQAPIFEHQATALYELGVSHADAREIFGENLLRIIAG
ncbi:MAG TPA: amidohydrolase family protein, partial [Bryobacteraceae bacterium]|nr:amidohydrolase family protein [Bryobacteraceae bacterium]